MPLQTFDKIVKSIKDTRPIFQNLTDREYAAWYSQKYMVTEERVLFILDQLREATHETHLPQKIM